MSLPPRLEALVQLQGLRLQERSVGSAKVLIHVCTCLHVHIYIYTTNHVYVYTYTYICLYIYIYTNTATWSLRLERGFAVCVVCAQRQADRRTNRPTDK